MPISNAISFRDIKARARKAKEKKALYGPDIDLSRYTQHIERGKIESLEGLSQQAKEAAILTGMRLAGGADGQDHICRLINLLFMKV